MIFKSCAVSKSEYEQKILPYLLLSFFQLITILFFFLAQVKAQEVVEGEYLIKFKKSSSDLTNNSVQESILDSLGVSEVESFELTGTKLVKTRRGEKLDQNFAKELLASGLVEYVEPNYIVHTSDTPNDSRYSDLWGLHNTGQTGGTNNVDIDAPEAWAITKGSQDVVVGIVDTGIDYTHPDLAANMWRNPGEIAGNSIDDDHNGVVDDVYGYNAITPSNSPYDDNSHGTHCAGTIGGVGNNGSGVTGVNWNVKLMALKFLDSSGSGTTSDAIEAIQYAVARKNAGVNIRVLSNSWGGGGFSQGLEDAISAANNAGILFVAAAGNSARDNDTYATYPANYEVNNVVSVAAVDSNGNLASFSNYGANTVHLAAPGVGIVSTVPNNSYASYNGTSMATPHVSGVAALILSHESLTVSQLKARLLSTVKPLNSLNGVVKYPGILDAYFGLTNSVQPLPEPGEQTGYSKSTATLNYDTSLGELVINSDDGFITKDLGFSFKYFDNTYSRVSISANGRVQPLATGEADPTTADYSNKSTPGISIYHDDLYPSSDSGGVYFKTDGTTATFTWVSVPYSLRNVASSDKDVKFQLKINSDNSIVFNYLDTYSGDSIYNYGATATVGIFPISSGSKNLVSNNTTNESEIGNSHALKFEMEEAAQYKRADIDGDEISDFIIWRPSSGFFFVLKSSTGYDINQIQGYHLGMSGDIPFIGNFDGDNSEDFAVWRPNDGSWHFLLSGTSYNSETTKYWGKKGDTPLVGKFDSDSITDIGYYRKDKGFYIQTSRTGASYSKKGKLQANVKAIKNSLPLVGDYNGDGIDDLTLVEYKKFRWTVSNVSGKKLSTSKWGEKNNSFLSCDWNSNGINDKVAIKTLGDSLQWNVKLDSGATSTLNFGSQGDIPSCATDYDNDGKRDISVFNKSDGIWYYRSSIDSSINSISFGGYEDKPL
ncbi:MAG: S8 family serine peptidase [Proteobacteria bacterium]|nr:S8 family serine peptidase [Pseudomonadota bacterium]